MADVTAKVAQIRSAVLGIDVRENIALGIEGINTEVVSTTAKQTALETVFDNLVINAGSSNAEVVAARGSAVSLPVRLSGVDAQLAETTTQLGLKTSKIYVDTLTASIASGSPKGTYATLAALQAAYPAPVPPISNNIYIVLASNGVVELDTLTVTSIPTVAGNVTITLNGAPTTVALILTDNTTDLVATKIRNTVFTGWTTGGSASVVTFTKATVGTNTTPTFSAGATGVAATIVVTTAGVALRTSDWYYWNGSAWTDGGVYQSTGLGAGSVTLPTLGVDTLLSIPSTSNTKGKVITDPATLLIKTGNNVSNPFITLTTTTALATGLADIDGNIVVSKGVGWQAVQYSAYAGFKIDLSMFSLSGLGAIAGDKLRIVYYRRLVDMNTETYAPSGFYIGTNKISLVSGAEVTVTAVGNGWDKVEVVHVITASDVTQNALVQFNVSYWGSSTGARLTQSLEMTAPLIYINDLNIFGYYTNMSRKIVDTKVIDLTTRQRRWKDAQWVITGDSFVQNDNLQKAIAIKLGCTVTAYGHAGQPISGCFTEIYTNPTILATTTILSCLAGTNDWSGNKPIGTIADATTVDTTFGSIKKAIETVLTAYPNIRMLFFTPIQRLAFPSTPTYPGPNSLGLYLEDYVQAIKDVGKLYSIPVCDLFNNSGFNKFTIPTWTDDGLHPNASIGAPKLIPIMTNYMEGL